MLYIIIFLFLTIKPRYESRIFLANAGDIIVFLTFILALWPLIIIIATLTKMCFKSRIHWVK